jgi:hypothetical protein
MCAVALLLVGCGSDDETAEPTKDVPAKNDLSPQDTSTKKDFGDPCRVFEACNTPGVLHCFDGAARTCVENTNNGCIYWSDPIDCDDLDPCTSDSCVEGDGCTYAFNTASCDAQSACTLLDQCLNGECIIGPERLFAANFPNAGSQGRALVESANGEFVIAGTQMIEGWPNARLLSLNTVGAVQWDNVYTESFGAFEDVALVAGKVTAGGRKGTTQASTIWMTQVDEKGGTIWSRIYSDGKGPDAINGMASIDGDLLVVVGITHSSGTQDGESWVAEINGQGDIIWEKNLDDGPGLDQFLAVAARPAGGVAIVGHTANGVGSKADARLVILNDLGEVLADHNYGGALDEKAFAVHVLPNNHVLMGGQPNSWLIQSDPLGRVLWERKYGSAVYDRLDAIARLNNGQLLLGGAWQDNEKGARILITNSQGHPHYEYSFASDSGRQIRSVTVAANHDIVMAGIANEGVFAARSTYWGQSSCENAGKCALLTPTACSLENPCETAVCNPALGCLDEANSLPCSVPDECSVQDFCEKKSCQPGSEKLFDKSYSAGGNEQGIDVVRTSESGFAVLIKNAAMAGGRVLRTDSAGKSLWSADLSPVEKFHPSAMVRAANDSFLVVGKSTANPEGSDAVALVVGAAGDLQGIKIYSADGQQGIEAVAELADGSRAYAGWTDAEGAGYFDALLVLTDTQGKVTETKTFGTQAEERALDIAIQGNGDILMAGFGNITGDKDFRLIRTTPSGGYLWQKVYGGDGEDVAMALVALPDDGALLVGSTTESAGNNQNVFLVRVDNVGKQLWVQTYGGIKNDWTADVVLMPDGGFAIAATTLSQGAGGSDFWLLRTDKEGKPEYDRTFGSTGADLGAALVILDDSGLGLVGTLEVDGISTPWLMRSDPFGNADCSAEGATQN